MTFPLPSFSGKSLHLLNGVTGNQVFILPITQFTVFQEPNNKVVKAVVMNGEVEPEQEYLWQFELFQLS